LAISTAFSSRSTAVTSVAPASLGGDGEAARIAAQVEDLEAFGQGAETAAVVALVAEETGLVAFGEIDLLGHAELLDLHETDGRLRDVGRHDAFDAGHVRVDLDDLALGADGVVQDGDPAGQPAHDADRRDFDREDVAEAVDDQAGQKVGVGVDHAVGVGVGVELQDITAQGDRAAEGLLEPGVVGLARGRLEDAEGDRGAGVPEAVADEGALLVVSRDHVALAGVGRDLADHRTEDGRLCWGMCQHEYDSLVIAEWRIEPRCTTVSAIRFRACASGTPHKNRVHCIDCRQTGN
jgi:hypothetical protein